jgi:hypothetical protein
MNKTAKREKTQMVLMEESWQKQPFHVSGDGKKGGNLELFLTQHSAKPGTANVL